MSFTLSQKWEECASIVDSFLVDTISRDIDSSSAGTKKLMESALYSVQSGGKRFRPVLSLLVADCLNIGHSRVLPYAAAIEMVHAYSLIHDDLPCMDDDDVRRGKATNHIVFGEAMALLAGNTLLTEAFRTLAKNYKSVPDVATELVLELASASGGQGMLAGQAMDIFETSTLTNSELEKLHRYKTGALIKAAVMGPAIIGRIESEKHSALLDFGSYLGLAFQIADDLLDYNESHPEPKSYTTMFGFENAKTRLLTATERAKERLAVFGPKAQGLIAMADFNYSRLK